MRQATIVSLGLVAGASTTATAFAPPPSAGHCHGHRQCAAISSSSTTGLVRKRSATTTSLTMVNLDEMASILSPRLPSFLGDSSFLGVPHSAYLDSLPTDLISLTRKSIVDDPRVESELFTDASHVALDLVTFASPAKAYLRLSMLVGRIFAIMADWIPDHTILPEELLFQSIMLGISASLLAKSCYPLLPALLTSTSYREKRAYQALFRKFGLSWMQFKMVTAFASEWVEVSANGQIDSNAPPAGASGNDGTDGYVYWLQKGEAELVVNDSTVQHVVASSSTSSDQIGILGELDFARRLQERKKSKKSNKKDSAKNQAQDETVDETSSNSNASVDQQVTTTSTPKIKAGPAGATLLRIDAAKLLNLMDDDESLAEGIRSIIFAGMQEKLLRVMEENSNKTATSSLEPAYMYAAYEHEI